MFINLCLGAIGVIASAVALLAYACIRAGVEYDQWVEEFERSGGIQTALVPVLQGSEVVGYTVVGERRTNR